MKTIEKVFILLLFLAICSLSFGQGVKDVKTDSRVKVQKPKMGKKLEQQGKKAAEVAEKKYLNSLDPEARKAIEEKVKGMDAAERRDFIESARRDAGEYIDGVQRGKPTVDGESRGTGEVDGVQRGKPSHAGKGKHEGHDHGSHEGHDHGSHEGHDHGSHEGHDHGKHKGHDHGKKNGHLKGNYKKGHYAERKAESKERINQATERSRGNAEKMAQASKRLDDKLAKGEITQAEFDAKKEKLAQLAKKMQDLESRRAAQAKKVENLKVPGAPK
jgi:hypothetical protein